MKPKKTIIVGNYTLTLLCAALINHSAQAASGTWNLDGNSVWNVATDPPWAGAIIADGTGDTADFSTIDITADRTVSLDTARTIGNLSFGDTNTATAGGWILNNNGNPANILTLAGTPVITVNALAAGKEATISAVLTGTSGLTKSGAGTLTLSAANTYTGGTTVNAGILKAGTTTAFGTAAGASIAFGPATTGKVQLNNFDMTFVGLNSNTSVGAPIVENGGATAKTLTINNAVANTYAGIFQKGAAGNLAITKTGAGLLTLTGSSSTSIGGNIIVDGGSLTLSSNGDLSNGNCTVGSTALAGSVAVTVTGQGTKWTNSSYFRLGQSSTSNSLTISNGAVLTSASTSAFTIGHNTGANNNTVTVTGNGSSLGYSDHIEVGRQGAGNTLNIENGASASCTLFWSSGGSSNPNGSSSSTVKIDGWGSTFTVGASWDIADRGTGNQFKVLNGGTANMTGGGYVGYYTGNVEITVDGSGSVWNTSALDWANGGSSANCTISNSGRWNANGQIAFKNNNSLNLNSGGELNVQTLNIAALGGRLKFNGGRLIAQSAGSLVNGSGRIQLLGTGTISTDFTKAIANVIEDVGGLTKEGTGTLSLTGLNTYDGTTTVSNGTLTLDLATNNTSGVLDSISGLALGGGNLNLRGRAGAFVSTQTMAGLTVNAGNSSVTVTPNTGTSSTLTLTSNTVSRANGGVVNFNNASGTPATGMIAWNPTLTGGIIDGGFSMTDNAGTDFATITAGKVTRFTGGTALAASNTGNPTEDFRANAGGLITNTVPSAAMNSLSIETSSGASTWDLGVGNSAPISTGGVLMTGGNDFTITNGSLNSLTATNSDLVIHQHGTGNLMIDSSIVNGNGASTLTKAGSGVLVLGGANSYTGTTFVEAGTLAYSANNVIGTGPVTVLGGTLNIDTYSDSVGAVTIKGGSLSGSGGILTSTSGFTCDVAYTASVSAILDGAVTLTKTGLGTVTLSNANSYTGLTTISTGTLTYGVNDAIAAGAVTINGGTLNIAGFSDTVGVVTLNNGSITGSGGTLTSTSNFILNGAAPVSVSAKLGGAVGLVKSGNSTATLTGINSYTGDTTVEEGTLSINNAYLADSSTVKVGIVANASASLNLNHAATDTIDKLYIDGVQMQAGTYGSSTSLAANKNDSAFSGNGILNVVSSPPVNAYLAWSTTTYGLSGGNAAFDFDYDKDGIPNGMEWILGGNPTVNDNSSILPAVTGTATGGLTLVFNRATASISETTLTVQWNTDLNSTWNSIPIGAVDVGPSGINPTVDIDAPSVGKVTVNIPAGNAVGDRIFARLKATNP
jgi:autotransporter-associated beta strand protein/T5SS/PEP-CTERM-associated repeat protein